MKKATLGFAICASLLPMLAPAADEGSFWISAGPAARGGMRIEASGSSRVQELGLRAARDFSRAPRAEDFRETGRSSRLEESLVSQTPAPAIGDLGAYADRTYDDGYVYIDPGTADPGSLAPGLTWFWGYDDAGQYDAGANTLELHARGTEERTEATRETVVSAGQGRSVASTVLRDDAFSQDQEARGVGFGIEGGWVLRERRGWDVALAGGLNALFGVQADFQATTWQERVRNRTWIEHMTQVQRRTTTSASTTLTTDRYDVGDALPFPAAGHQGTYDGPFDVPPTIPSPLIPNTPDNRTQTPDEVIASSSATSEVSTTVERGAVQTEEWEAANRVWIDVDATVCQLWLGPQAAFRFADRWRMHLTPAVSLNCLSVSVSREEQFVATGSDGRLQALGMWKDDAEETAWVPGAFLDCGVECDLNRRWAVGVYARYDLIQAADFSAGPSAVTLDASGYSVGATVKRWL